MLVPEANVKFGGMHVYVDSVGSDGKKKESVRETLGAQQGSVGPLQKRGHPDASHGPFVDEKEYFRPGRAGDCPGGNEALYKAPFRGGADGNKGVGEVRAPQLAQPRLDGLHERQCLVLGRQVEDFRLVHQVAEADVRMSKHRVLHEARYVPELRGVGLQKLRPDRHAEEKVFDADGRALGARRVADRHVRSSLHLDAGRRSPISRGRRHLKAGNARDRRKRLAPEAQGPDVGDVDCRPDLAGRVAHQGHLRVFPRHAAAVIGDRYEFASAFHNFDANTPGAGVQGVLDELLDHRGGALHHFARGYLVGHVFREEFYLSIICHKFKL